MMSLLGEGPRSYPMSSANFLWSRSDLLREVQRIMTSRGSSDLCLRMKCTTRSVDVSSSNSATIDQTDFRNVFIKNHYLFLIYDSVSVHITFALICFRCVHEFTYSLCYLICHRWVSSEYNEPEITIAILFRKIGFSKKTYVSLLSLMTQHRILYYILLFPIT